MSTGEPRQEETPGPPGIICPHNVTLTRTCVRISQTATMARAARIIAYRHRSLDLMRRGGSLSARLLTKSPYRANGKSGPGNITRFVRGWLPALTVAQADGSA